MNIEEFQKLCAGLPSVTEDVKWENDLVFSIGGKMFCVTGLNETPVTAAFKVTEEQFDELCERKGFKPAPYVAKYKWVKIDDINKMTKKEWEKYVTQSYTLVRAKLAPKILKTLK